jgi:hypothetical protein
VDDSFITDVGPSIACQAIITPLCQPGINIDFHIVVALDEVLACKHLPAMGLWHLGEVFAMLQTGVAPQSIQTMILPYRSALPVGSVHLDGSSG